MEKHYLANQKRFSELTDNDLKIALKQSEDHLKWKLRQRTLYGAHSEVKLGEDPIDYYMLFAYEKLLNGNWEWKDDYSLGQQLIRIIDSKLSTEVEKTKTKKAAAFELKYVDPDANFYTGHPTLESDPEEELLYEKQIRKIEAAVKGDVNLEIMWEAIKEGKKGQEIAEILEISPKQLNKLRESFKDRVRKFNQEA